MSVDWDEAEEEFEKTDDSKKKMLEQRKKLEEEEEGADGSTPAARPVEPKENEASPTAARLEGGVESEINVMQGYLLKQGHKLMKQYQKRYFVLTNQRFSWAEKEGGAELGGADASEITGCTMADDKTLSILLPKKVYYIRAVGNDMELLKKWRICLRNVSKKGSNDMGTGL
eukprot:NODE_2082_length_657_cov_91.567925_g2032_i0.p1 GENE.NODE_2082_length_657_cov_91.567925_g2032_i0~~NODE_2082_length_657_cov_91.567925_g2032_i0.p1  ORF type:complete len:172 (+),score=37.17 NODE_2082_length_657_cov_91.567925_g2032_i0:129-644(+)